MPGCSGRIPLRRRPPRILRKRVFSRPWHHRSVCANITNARERTSKYCCTGWVKPKHPCRSNVISYGPKGRKTLNRAWMKFWLCASLLALTVSAGAVSQKQKGDQGKNELTLASIQPGRDKLSGVEKLLNDHLRPDDAESAGHSWSDPCSGRRLSLEVDRTGLIQTVTISSATTHENCKSKV